MTLLKCKINPDTVIIAKEIVTIQVIDQILGKSSIKFGMTNGDVIYWRYTESGDMQRMLSDIFEILRKVE